MTSNQGTGGTASAMLRTQVGAMLRVFVLLLVSLLLAACQRAGEDPHHPAAAQPCDGRQPAAVVSLDNSAVGETFGTFELDQPTTLWWTSTKWQPMHNLGFDNPTVGTVWLGPGPPPAADTALVHAATLDVAIEPELWTRTELPAGQWWVRSGGTGSPVALVAAACQHTPAAVAEQVPAAASTNTD